jgi:thioesterase domain-containing protein
LALLDTKIDAPAGSARKASRRIVQRCARTVNFNVKYAIHIGVKPFLRQKTKNWRIRMHIRLWSAQKALGRVPDASLLDVEEAFVLALRSYTPKPYSGDAILFRAKDELVAYSDATLGWGALVLGSLEIREVSGDHDTILYEPHIGTLARVLNSCLHAVHDCFTQPQPPSARGMKAAEQSA